jgi:adenosylhomocysteinase
VVVAVTGVPGGIGRSLPSDWIRANRPVLVNLGAEDEFGPSIPEREILGGRGIPLNIHLPRPTRNRYVDPALAAHLLALEALVREPDRYPQGIHPLPPDMDAWVVRTWRQAWPGEDLLGIAADLGLG